MMLKVSLGDYGMQHRGQELQAYSKAMVALHWIMAVLLLYMLVQGFTMISYEGWNAERVAMYQLHKQLGLLALSLAVVRLCVRLKSVLPKPYDSSKVLRVLAVATHRLFYVFLLAMPLSGWLMSSAVQKPPRLFAYTLMFPIAVSKKWAWVFSLMHNTLAWIGGVMITLHIFAVVWHVIKDRHGQILARMRW